MPLILAWNEDFNLHFKQNLPKYALKFTIEHIIPPTLFFVALQVWVWYIIKVTNSKDIQYKEYTISKACHLRGNANESVSFEKKCAIKECNIREDEYKQMW